MRISRPCFDKPHRCPGWAGGGWRYVQIDNCPQSGYINGIRDSWWRPRQCDECSTWVLPYTVRGLFPSWYRRWVPPGSETSLTT